MDTFGLERNPACGVLTVCGFFPWTSPDGKHLPSSTIFALLVARDGSLWIGTAAGIAHFVNDKLVEFPDFHDEG